MSKHQYVVWFRDTLQSPEDQDYEWVACILIAAESEALAQEWGDHLAALYCRRWPHNQFLRSYFDPEPWAPEDVPSINYGETASDDVIGW